MNPAKNEHCGTDVAAQVSHVLANLFELEESIVTSTARLREDLDLDSLDGVDIVVALEQHFGVIVDDENVRKMRTVGEIQAYVEARLASSSS